MFHKYFAPLEPYVTTLYILHIFISIVMGVILSFVIAKRFRRKGEDIDKRDFHRLEEIANRSLIFRLFFKVSLHKNNRITSILFLTLFNLAMPLVGYGFSIWIAYYLRTVSYNKKVTNTNILNLDEFGMSFLKVERIFGEGSMVELMNNKYAPKSKKLKALSSLSSQLSPANLRIIRSTLSSNDDEIRMYGYATINKAEKALNIKINKHLEILQEESDPEIRAASAKELAELYWEMVYTELSHESLKADFLKEVKQYVKMAKDYYYPKSKALQHKLDSLAARIKKSNENVLEFADEPKYRDENIELKKEQRAYREKILKYNNILTKLFLLMGKVYMNEKNYERASTEFTIAQELYDGSSSFILPYLAEIQFLTGNYSIVHSIINQSKDLGLNATLYPIIEQWKRS